MVSVHLLMSTISVFIEVIVPLALVWAVGFLARRLLSLEPKPFSRAGLYLLSPTVIFTSLMESKITAEDASRLIALVFLLAAALYLVSSLEGRLLKLSLEQQSAFLLASIFINAVNYGFPVALLAFGKQGLEVAAIFAVGHAILSNTGGAYIAARGRSHSVAEAVRQTSRIPMLYAVVLALILRFGGVSLADGASFGGFEISLLPSIYNAVKLLSQAAIPVFMLVLGMQLADTSIDSVSSRLSRKTMFLATLTRLIVSPILAWGLTGLLGLTGLPAKVAILEAAMPTAVLAVILAVEFDAKPQLVARTVLWTTLLSTVTVTFLLSAWK